MTARGGAAGFFFARLLRRIEKNVSKIGNFPEIVGANIFTTAGKSAIIILY